MSDKREVGQAVECAIAMGDITLELLEAAESVHDGWFSEDPRVDWEEFVDRLETYADTDLGSSMISPQIKAIQRHIRQYRKLG